MHFVTMLALLFGVIQADWRVLGPYVLALTLIHFGLDTGKNTLSRLKPRWVIGPYLLDQVCHITFILLITYLMTRVSQVEAFALTWPWAIYGTGYVLVTHVWFVTERVLNYAHKPYQQAVNTQAGVQMLGRAILLSALLLGWTVWGLIVLVTGLVFEWLHLPPEYRRPALPTDVGVALGVMVFIQVAQLGG